MSDLLQGHNEAYHRLRAMEHQTNTGGIMYPKGTNDRGYTHSSREHHAHGERVGGSEREHHAHGEMVGKKKGSSVGNESSPPGHGGSHMKPHFGAPKGGVEDGAPRRLAVKQARAENHSRGERVGDDDEKHAMGGPAGKPRPGAMMGPRHMGARAATGGRMKSPEKHAMGGMAGNARSGAMMGPNPIGGMKPRGMPTPQPMGAYRKGGKTDRKDD